jgi:hypothetical protein
MRARLPEGHEEDTSASAGPSLALDESPIAVASSPGPNPTRSA